MDRLALRSLASRLGEPGCLPSRGITQALLNDRDYQEGQAHVARVEASEARAALTRVRRLRGRIALAALISRVVIGLGILAASFTGYEGLLDLTAFGVGALLLSGDALLCGPSDAPKGDDA